MIEYGSHLSDYGEKGVKHCDTNGYQSFARFRLNCFGEGIHKVKNIPEFITVSQNTLYVRRYYLREGCHGDFILFSSRIKFGRKCTETVMDLCNH